METLEVLTAWLLYGVVHSATASLACKARVAALVGERAFLGLYRLSYCVVSTLAVLPVVAFMASRPGQTLWRVEGGAADLLLASRVVGVIGVAVALLQIDGLRFLGLREAIAYFGGRPLPLPPERLEVRGVYRLVRHPLYLFGLIALWSGPVMTESSLGLVIGVTIYVAVGSTLEERKMTRAFGPEYDAYRKSVPWLIPFVKPGR